MKLTRIAQLGWVALVLSLPLVAWGAWHALQLQPNHPIDWVSPEVPVRAEYERFTQAFESADVAVVSWEGCTLEDPRLTALVAAARDQSQFAAPDGTPCLERVLSGAEVYERLTSPPLRLDPETALARLQGVLIGPDQNTTCAVCFFSQAGVAHRDPTLARLQRAAAECGVPPAELRLAGPIVDGWSVDKASAASLHRFGGISALAIFLLCWRCLRQLRDTALIFVLAYYCAGVTLACVYLTGGQISALLIVLQPLVLALGVSGGIHFANHFAEALTRNATEPGRLALKLGWLPSFLSATTTVIGLGSLCISQLEPIRSFGWYAAAGVSATFLTLVWIAPGTLEWWCSDARRQAEPTEVQEPLHTHAWWQPLDRLLRRAPGSVALTIGLAMFALGWGAQYLQASVRIQTLFPPHSTLLRDYAWLEEHIGPLVPLEIVLHFPPDNTLRPAERLGLVEQVEAALWDLPAVGATVSPATFLPEESGILRRDLAIRRALPRLDELRYVRTVGDEQCWRVTARVSALEDLDYGRLLTQIREHVTPVIERSAHGTTVSATYTGAFPMVHELQRRLLDDLFTSFLSAFGVIAVVMMVTLGGIFRGLLSMASNLFPMVILFGLLGWLRWPLDIGSVMTASVALGIAIDDTLHFLTFFRRGLAAGLSRPAAVTATFASCATAMVQSSVVCGCGMLPFALSEFVPTSRFAWMMLALLMLALVGDLVLLPALVLSPLGRWFEPRESSS